MGCGQKLQVNYTYKGLNYSLTVEWMSDKETSVIFQYLTHELLDQHGLDLHFWEDHSKKLDELADVLYQQFMIFISEYAGTPYNPRMRKRIIGAWTELVNYYQSLPNRENDLEAAIIEAYSKVLEKLQVITHLYLEDFAYQSKFHERKKKETQVEEISLLNANSDFENKVNVRIQIENALATLTPTQKRRLVDHLVYSYTFQEIAKREGISWQSVQESIIASKNKMKAYLSKQ